jgi:hypothetical protein
VIVFAITWRILIPNCLEHALARYRTKPSNWDQWMGAFLGWKDSQSIESNPAIGISGWRPFWAGRTHDLSNQTRAIGFSLATIATMDGDGGLSRLGGLTVYRIKPGNWDQWMETFLGTEDSRSIESYPAIGISGWRPFWAGRTHDLSNQTRQSGSA